MCRTYVLSIISRVCDNARLFIYVSVDRREDRERESEGNRVAIDARIEERGSSHETLARSPEDLVSPRDRGSKCSSFPRRFLFTFRAIRRGASRFFGCLRLSRGKTRVLQVAASRGLTSCDFSAFYNLTTRAKYTCLRPPCSLFIMPLHL